MRINSFRCVFLLSLVLYMAPFCCFIAIFCKQAQVVSNPNSYHLRVDVACECNELTNEQLEAFRVLAKKGLGYQQLGALCRLAESKAGAGDVKIIMNFIKSDVDESLQISVIEFIQSIGPAAQPLVQPLIKMTESDVLVTWPSFVYFPGPPYRTPYDIIATVGRPALPNLLPLLRSNDPFRQFHVAETIIAILTSQPIDPDVKKILFRKQTPDIHEIMDLVYFVASQDMDPAVRSSVPFRANPPTSLPSRWPPSRRDWLGGGGRGSALPAKKRNP
jgi:hypothetical protein